MTFEIKEMKIDDYDEVYDFWKNTDGIGLSNADKKGNLAFFFEKNPGTSFVALSEGKIAGTVMCSNDGRRGFIYHLAVRKEARNNGIGSALVDSAFGALKSIGIQKCHIFVLKDNEEGMKFWKKTGWSKRNDIVSFSYDLI